jgi:hypothetical protein
MHFLIGFMGFVILVSPAQLQLRSWSINIVIFQVLCYRSLKKPKFKPKKV